MVAEPREEDGGGGGGDEVDVFGGVGRRGWGEEGGGGREGLGLG